MGFLRFITALLKIEGGLSTSPLVERAIQSSMAFASDCLFEKHLLPLVGPKALILLPVTLEENKPRA